jgi:hypothetical protein
MRSAKDVVDVMLTFTHLRKMLRLSLFKLAAAAILAVTPQVAFSQIVVASTFGPNTGPFNSCSIGGFECRGRGTDGLAVNYGQAVATGFTFTGATNVNLQQVQLALIGSGSFSIGLWQGSVPGLLAGLTLLESWTCNCSGLSTFLSTRTPTLESDVNYWITANSPNSGAGTGWWQSTVRGGHAVMGSPYDARSGWAFYTTANQMAFEVLATQPTPPVAIVPEPSMFILSATGLGVLLAVARRRRSSLA